MSVIDEIAAERRRQIEEEAWTPEHDDEHRRGELAAAAAVYALNTVDVHEGLKGDQLRMYRFFWPWEPEWWKPKSRRADLIRAAALIVAEIQRLDRKRRRRDVARDPYTGDPMYGHEALR